MKIERVARVLVTIEDEQATREEINELFRDLEKSRLTYTPFQRKLWETESLEFIEWEPEEESDGKAD